MNKKIYTTAVDDDGFIKFPEELMDELGWLEGDLLRWVNLNNSAVSIINLTAEHRKFMQNPDIYPGVPNDSNFEVD